MRRLTPAGRKAGIIALLGLLWVSMGVYVAIDDAPIDPAKAIIYETAFPVWVRVTTWVVTGAVAIVALPWRPLRRYASAALMVMVAEKLVGYGASLLAFLLPGEPPGWGPAASSLAAWLTIGAIIYLIAGLPEDDLAPEAV